MYSQHIIYRSSMNIIRVCSHHTANGLVPKSTENPSDSHVLCGAKDVIADVSANSQCCVWQDQVQIC